MPRKKSESASRAAKKSQIPPVPDAEHLPWSEGVFLGGMGQPMPDLDALRMESEGGISVPPDSTDALPVENEKESLAALLICKQVSVTELTKEGRGLRLYLGKPTMATFEHMLRRSSDGVIIEPDPRQGDLAVVWKK